MRLTPERPVFLHVVSPLDAPITPPDTDNITVTLVAKDRYGNPTDMTAFGELQVFAYHGAGPGTAPRSRFCRATAVSGVSGYRASCEGQISREGLVRFGVDPLPTGVTQVYNYTMVSEEPTYVRKVGDTHIHAGMQLDEAPAQFMRSSQGGDHKADSARIKATLEYLEKVSVYDFGAISHHSVLEEGWQVPSGAAYAPFLPGGGGDCDVDPPGQGGRALRYVYNWWIPAQQASEEYQAEADEVGSEFYSYPAFEWHGEYFFGDPPNFDDPNRPRLHRVVMFRDHRPDADWPLLPGSAYNRSPLCLVLYIQNHINDGTIDLEEVLIMPHMMTPGDANNDWWLTYQDTLTMSALNVNRDDVEELHRVGEIYSARSRDTGEDLLTAFEGSDPPDEPQAFTYRYGWREAEAVIGVIGSSDNHQRMPGLNDDLHGHRHSYDQNEPTGTAIVLAERGGSFRDTIFDALRDRRTYATSGVRAWLDFRLVLAGGEEVQMGEDVCLEPAAAPTIEAELAVGMPIHTIQIWEGTPGDSNEPYVMLKEDFPYRASPTGPKELWSNKVPIDAPGAAQRKLYYFRAFLGSGEPPFQEAVWSSPIWVDWQESCPDELARRPPRPDGPDRAAVDPGAEAAGAHAGR